MTHHQSLLGRRLAAMKRSSRLIGMLICCVLPAVSFLPVSAAETRRSSGDRCAEAKQSFTSKESAWSSANASARILRYELERVRDFRWGAKVVWNVLDDAIKIMGEQTGLSSAQRITLNARIPMSLAALNEDGTISMAALGSVPMTLEDGRSRLNTLLNQAEGDLARVESELRAREEEGYRLSQELATLEEKLEKECRAAGMPTIWQEGGPRMTDGDLYQQYVDRERQRQEEVDSRRYYRGYGPYGYPPGPLYPPYGAYP